jgi:ribosomal protein L40E
MAKFPEAEARKFRNRYVCRKCKSVMKAPPRKMIEGEIKCRNCASRAFKPKRKR